MSNPLQQAVILQLLESIAQTETSLAYLIETEADKLQTAITLVERDEENVSIDPLLEMNQSVKKMLETIIKKEMLLEFELDDLLDLLKQPSPTTCDTTIGIVRNPEDANEVWFIIEWLGTTLNTWEYRVTNVSAPFGLSHFSFYVPCISEENTNGLSVISSTPVETEVRENDFCPDGNPLTCGNPEGFNGIKFNYQLEQGESETFTFTLNQSTSPVDICVLFKFGTLARCTTICGPSC
ncbi:hypothetical protein HMI01_24340 [Halolactibacillus miurensis]|uniref:Uncharacterized protein n=1 Tax=Halolactibacillus miurensis TaxID=306541 RepID=A0A1I6TVL4_9BACI|nr:MULTISPECIES: hypothetical protein [Halolactibacillus]GEM05446.1 hypothetical protein HMI01_24340 [Halolactibacillus miurensis]SFS93148.1 hypothetical protein SAMN05421668_11839 [Halolactibacillus miurensis]